jgi:hypothetical protein
MNRDVEAIAEYLAKERDRAIETMASAEGVVYLHQAQGRYQLAQEILRLIENRQRPEARKSFT